MKKTIIFIGLVIVFCVISFKMLFMPVYPGELSISLKNNTSEKITDLIIEFEDSEYEIEIDEIKSMERIIVIPPNNIYDKPRKASVYIKYNNNRFFLEDYNVLSYSKYNLDTIQTMKVSISETDIKVMENTFWCRFSICPYFSVYDLRQG